MKTLRRVEIRMFQRKVTVFENLEADQDEIRKSSAQTESSLETVSPDSPDGRRMLSTVLRLLEEYLSD